MNTTDSPCYSFLPTIHQFSIVEVLGCEKLDYWIIIIKQHRGWCLCKVAIREKQVGTCFLIWSKKWVPSNAFSLSVTAVYYSTNSTGNWHQPLSYNQSATIKNIKQQKQNQEHPKQAAERQIVTCTVKAEEPQNNHLLCLTRRKLQKSISFQRNKIKGVSQELQLRNTVQCGINMKPIHLHVHKLNYYKHL